MKKTIIYRIQDNVGRGPWRPGFSTIWIKKRPDHDNLIPWFNEFGPVHKNKKPTDHIGCGCQTIDQLKRWINKTEYRTLKKYGFQAVKMPIDSILAMSNIQCVFLRSKPLYRDVKIFKLY